MAIRQFTRLIGNCLGDFLTPIADVDTVKPGESIQQMIASRFSMNTPFAVLIIWLGLSPWACWAR